MPNPLYKLQDFMNRTSDTLKVAMFYAIIGLCIGYGVARWL